MDILQYLIELLKTRKQIGIEGLGTFYKKKTPGRYDAETHSFLPPSYALEFSSDVLEHANLSQYIQTKRGISEDSAKYFISQFVNEIQKGLQNGEYQLENLGFLTQTGNELIFKANQDINIGFDFFALPTVTANVQQPETIGIETTKPVTSATNETPAPEPKIEQPEVPEFEHEMAKLEGQPLTESNETEPQEKLNEEATPEETLASPPVDDAETTAESKDIETPEEILTEEQLPVEEIHEEITEVETQEIQEDTATSIENNEATDTEVYEEIAEVDTENPTGENNEIDAKEEKRIPETWNFEGENVISDDDVYQEDETEENESTSDTNLSRTENHSDLGKAENEDELTLTATTHEWDFDDARNRISEENTLIGEYDDDELEEPLEDEKRTMPLYQKVSIGLLVAAVLIAIVYFVKPELFQNFGKPNVNPNEKMVVPIERSNLQNQKDSLDFADSIMQNAEKVGLDVQPAKDTLKVTTNKSEVKPTITYDIIAAAFARESEVEEYIAYMKKHGFEAKIAKMPGKLYKKISIASYNNIDSAQKYVVKFRKQFKNPKMYVQPIKNN